MSGLNNDTIINILDKVGSIITQNTITFTELEDRMHEYLRLWMSVSSMTKGLQFWISGVNNDACINILDRVELQIS